MKISILLLVICLFIGPQTPTTQKYPFEVTVYGTGTPVLLVPGFSCPAEVWEKSIGPLKEGYELHVFTLAGFGEVDPIGFPWLPQIKKGMKQYIEDKDLKNPLFVGHSMGGTLGLWLAAENPNMFQKVISVDGLPAMGAVMFPNYDPKNFSYDSAYNRQTLAMDDTQFTGMAHQFAFGMTLHEEKRPLLVEWMKQADRETYVYGYTDLLALDLRAQLTKVEVPVTVFAATHPYGETSVKNIMETQFANLKDYKLILAQESAHFIMFDKPEWFIGELQKELSR